ncbi:hypothetical protein [Aliiruegeria sabulilitoris]|uniref:hypothetical protein n=1 Tax=Aliiruegeria sabulilitoris TaxID=1510458 RepID=UPI0012E3E2C0|nr:hypothetical protein [Aliiruegeria sabulilitoris]NDR55287.1 hypothetical protein [Pseudoruegeria sp. M32A2M]
MTEDNRETGGTGRVDQAARPTVPPGCLVDGTYIRLMHHSGESEPVLVVFGDEVTGPRGQVARPLGLKVQEDTDLYEVIPKGRHWYPVTETGPMSESLARAKDGKRAVALGASMGGYGALRYGARAGCGTVLAFSPQARLEPGMTTVGARHARNYREELHSDMDVEPAHLPERAYVVIDPADAHDLLHAELLRHEAGVEVIALAHMGHRCERALSSPEVVDRALEAATAGNREGLARALRRGRRNVPGYLARLSLACSERGHPQWGADIARLPEREGKPLSLDLRLALAVARAGMGQPFEALEQIESLIVSAPRNAGYWRALAEQYEAMGEEEAASDVMQLALEETENFLFCWKLIRNRMDTGAKEEALLLAEMALEHWPERAAQVEKIKERIASAA